MPAAPSVQPESISPLAAFLQGLTEDGRVPVSGRLTVKPDERAAEVLRELDRRARLELPYEAPDFHLEAALWAATLFYDACRFAVCRDVSEEEVVSSLSRACPAENEPATVWSVDLTFRQLAVLYRFARQLSSVDPLVTAIQQLAVAWPLSSVGIGPLGSVQIDSFVSHPALSRLYADRILVAGDISRLGNLKIDELLQADLGVHHTLAPQLASILFLSPIKEPRAAI